MCNIWCQQVKRVAPKLIFLSQQLQHKSQYAQNVSMSSCAGLRRGMLNAQERLQDPYFYFHFYHCLLQLWEQLSTAAVLWSYWRLMRLHWVCGDPSWPKISVTAFSLKDWVKLHLIRLNLPVSGPRPTLGSHTRRHQFIGDECLVLIGWRPVDDSSMISQWTPSSRDPLASQIFTVRSSEAVNSWLLLVARPLMGLSCPRTSPRGASESACQRRSSPPLHPLSSTGQPGTTPRALTQSAWALTDCCSSCLLAKSHFLM